MVLEKKYYTITELTALGYSRYELLNSTRIQGQTFATRVGNGRGSTWKFDLQAYEKFRKDRAAAQDPLKYEYALI